MKEKVTKSKLKQDILDIVKFVIIILAMYLLIFKVILGVETVSGPSMQPTFESGDKVITLRHSSIKRGDIVILKAPDNPNALYIKRVIGLPGDKISYKDDQLYLNGKKVSEKYLTEGKREFSPDTTYTTDFSLQSKGLGNKVPTNDYFVMGDHRNVSKDIRYFGYVKKDKIIGKVILRYWPLTSWATY